MNSVPGAVAWPRCVTTVAAAAAVAAGTASCAHRAAVAAAAWVERILRVGGAMRTTTRSGGASQEPEMDYLIS